MSYHRSPLSGVASQPPGARVSRGALTGVGDITEYGLPTIGAGTRPRPPRVRAGALSSDVGPRWYQQMQGSTLGADDTGPSSILQPTLADPAQTTRQATLDTLQTMQRQEAARIKLEERRGYLQLAATLSIPFAAFIWKKLLKRDTSAP